MVGEVDVQDLLQLHLDHDPARPVLSDQVAKSRKKKAEGVRGQGGTCHKGKVFREVADSIGHV